MQEMIIEIMNQFGYFGVAFLIMIENIFPPIPSEVILTFGGFMTTYTELGVWGVVIAATIGSVLGAAILYYIGYVLSVDRLETMISGKLGKILRLKKGDIRKAESWFMKRGYATIFFCRFIPLIRSLISIPAGSAKMKFPNFLLLTTLGTLIWNVVLVFLGRALGDNWESIAQILDNYSNITVMVLVVVFIAAVFYFIKKRVLDKPKK
ncbi:MULTISPECIES: DedA family protein [unclassified Lactococcus]|uniref:DedA family protein n=1 Tax=unclassified Lactococcus TaxID=2643510 RepID=UPI0011CB395C|nr:MULTISPECIES: DedA family protein [unclassified Lactococcus]MQW22185.1 DedA family protein [Lactococcus sp. dk101]TXK45119.1 DedA family protein [Lactococcus sp. dk310]TXK51101.1 DedA family protein [Lactococcus sp. dk322]